MIATCGGTMTSFAKRPPIMPKFERVMVAPRSSSGGIERPHVGRMRQARRADRLASRSPTLRMTGTMSPSSVSTAIPRSMRLMSRRSPACGIVLGVERWLGLACGGDRADEADGDVVALVPVLDIGVVRYPGRATSACACAISRHCAPHAAQRLRRASLGMLLAARSTSARVIVPPGPRGVHHLRSTSSLRASARTAGRTGSAPGACAARPLVSRAATSCRSRPSSPTTVPVSSARPSEFDQRRPDLDHVALGAEQPRDTAAQRRWDLDHRLVGFHRDERLVGDDVVTLVDVPCDDLRLFQAFAQIRQIELSMRVTPMLQPNWHALRAAATMRSTDGM